MKIKKFIGIAVAAVATVMMSSAVFAATGLKINAVQSDDDYTPSGTEAVNASADDLIWLPISLDSSDNSNVTSMQFTIKYDKSKYKFDDDTFCYALNKKKDVFNVAGNDADGSGNLAVVVTLNTAAAVTYGDAEKYSPLLAVGFTAISGGAVSADEFSIADGAIIYTLDDVNGTSRTKITATDLATYVVYDEIPTDEGIAGSEWEGKYVHEVIATFTVKGEEKSVSLKNFSKDTDNNKCVFVLKLIPSVTGEKITVENLKITAKTSKSADDATLGAADVTKEYGNVVVEKLQ